MTAFIILLIKNDLHKIKELNLQKTRAKFLKNV